MAWPMMKLILEKKYSKYFKKNKYIDRSILVYGAGESQLIDIMKKCEKEFPETKIYSLPSIGKKENRIELGVVGDAKVSKLAINFLKKNVLGHGFEIKKVNLKE